MFGARRGRPSLIGAAARTSARTAVIVGTANAMTRPRGGAAAPAAAAPTAAPAAGGLDAESIGRLKEIAELHAAGILNDAEFADQKAKILGG